MYSAAKIPVYHASCNITIVRKRNNLMFVMQRVNVEPIHAHIFALEFAELPTRKYIFMWPLKPDEGRILKDFLLNQSNATAKHVALAFVENAMTVERADVLYQIEALVGIASETPPFRQAKLIELLLEIRRLAIFATGGSDLIDYIDWQSCYGNDFPLLEMKVIEEESSKFRCT